MLYRVYVKAAFNEDKLLLYGNRSTVRHLSILW